MKIFLLLLVCALLAPCAGWSQDKFVTHQGRVNFHSSSLMEDIDASTTAADVVFELSTKQLAFSVPVRDFAFKRTLIPLKRTLMEKYFNKNYLESNKYPKATFVGRFTGVEASGLNTPGLHRVQVAGELTMHGVTRHVTADGTLELRDNKLLAFAFFAVAPADYNVEVPLLLRKNIAKVITIKVNVSCASTSSSALPLTQAAN